MTSMVASARGARVPKLQNHVAALATLGGHRPLTHTLLASSDFDRAIRACVAEAPPDVVLAFCTGIGERVLRTPLQNIPCVLDMVDVDSEKWAELGNSHRGPMRWIYRREARLLRAFEQRIARHAAV